MIKDDVLRDAEEIEAINLALDTIRFTKMNRKLADEVNESLCNG